MAEWLIEEGIGETRAALIEHGALVEMAIEAEDDPHPHPGAILPARLTRRADASARGAVTLADGTVCRLAPVPGGMAEGAALTVEIVRAPLPEAGGWKPALARPSDASPRAGATLVERLAAGGLPMRVLPTGDDTLAVHGWGERLEEAERGIVATPALLLRLSLTPAMTLIDVDGAGDAAALAIAGAGAAAAAIRLFGIAGSIGIDLPTLAGKADRLAAARALDAALPPPFERTAVNGFGFLQVVRRRARMSLPERLAADPIGHAGRALLRQGERARGHGTLTLNAAPAVIERLQARPLWIDALARRAGAPVALRAEAGLAISAGHAARAQP